MGVVDWWNSLDWETQHWIATHLGEVLPDDIATKAAAAGAPLHRTRFLDGEPTAYRLRQRDARQILKLSQRAA